MIGLELRIPIPLLAAFLVTPSALLERD